MSIAAFYKVTLAGPVADKDKILDALQSFGRLHLIVRDQDDADAAQLSARDKRTLEAVHYLLHAPYPNQPLSHWPVHHRHKRMSQRVQELVDAIINNRDQLRDSGDRIDALRQRIRLLQPWGDFSLPPDTCINHFRLWFYRLPVNKRRLLDKLDIPWQIAGRSNRFYHLILVSTEEPAADILPVPREHLGARSLQALQEELEVLEAGHEDLQSERQRLSRYRYLLQQQTDAANDRAARRHAALQINTDGQVFTLHGWLPVRDLPALQTLGDQDGFAVLAEAPEAGDIPPTLLQPPAPFSPGALLARIYQLPGYHSWDPSVHLYLSFALFFAMILSDAGYALFLLAILLPFWRRLGASAGGRQWRPLLLTLLSGATLWGALTGSYFGFDIVAMDQAPALLRALKIVDLNNYSSMMTLSVAVGIAHIVLAQLSLGWNQRHQPTRLAERGGWLLLIAAGVAFWQSFSPVLAGCLLGCGALFIIGGRALSQPHKSGITARLQQLAAGLLALASASSLFGDILSYMRLFALGLASASLGLTFNNLAIAALHSAPGIGVLFAGLIFLLGHTINLGLAIMSATVHGLRLNFIEFYNWGEPGEGYAYAPFCRRAPASDH